MDKCVIRRLVNLGLLVKLVPLEVKCPRVPGSLEPALLKVVEPLNVLLALLQESLHLVVHDELLEEPNVPCPLDLRFRVRQPLCKGLLGLSATLLQAFPEDFRRGRLEEQEVTGQAAVVDLYSTLDVDIQHTYLLGRDRVLELVEVRSVEVPMDLGMLKEFALLELLLELIQGDEVVVNTVLFAVPWLARCA